MSQKELPSSFYSDDSLDEHPSIDESTYKTYRNPPSPNTSSEILSRDSGVATGGAGTAPGSPTLPRQDLKRRRVNSNGANIAVIYNDDKEALANLKLSDDQLPPPPPPVADDDFYQDETDIVFKSNTTNNNDNDEHDTSTNNSTAASQARSPENEMNKRQCIEHLINDLSASVVYEMLSKNARTDPRFGQSMTKFVEQTRSRRVTNTYFWNDTFQAIMDLDNDAIKYQKLRNLAHDFTHAASVYGRIIISERFLPSYEKTIKPIDAIGGTAGGLKYICGGILFKFCVDTKLSTGWMYGGNQSSDERAMKTGGHELKAIINLLSLSPKETKRVHFPMMAVVDYRGFRLLAVSLLPIDRSTCVYGSPDGGATVYAVNEEFNASVRCLADQLNIAEHTVKHCRICGPGDIEGHIGRDKRFYLIDLARVFPAQWPERSSNNDKRHVFYELFRPEFVRNWTSAPICSDAFTRWLTDEKEKETQNAIAKCASEALYSKNIPNFALHEVPSLLHPIHSNNPTSRAHISALNHQLNQMLNKLHNRGINIRHLGRIYELVPAKHSNARYKILSEMTARCLKNIIRKRLREKMRGLAFPGEEPYRQELITYINMLLGHHVSSNDYWTLCFDGTNTSVHPFGPSIRHAILAKFGSKCLDALPVGADLRYFIGIPTTLTRLVHMLGLVLTEQCLNELHTHPNSLRLVGADLVDTGVRVKHMGVVNLADARALLLEAQARNKSLDTSIDGGDEVERLLVLSRRLFEQALASMPDSFDILSGLGDVSYELAVRRSPVPIGGEAHLVRLELMQASLTYYAESLRAKDFSNVGRRILARLVRVLCELASDPRASPQKAAELYSQAGIYADDAMDAEHGNVCCLDNFIRSCIGPVKPNRVSSNTARHLKVPAANAPAREPSQRSASAPTLIATVTSSTVASSATVKPKAVSDEATTSTAARDTATEHNVVDDVMLEDDERDELTSSSNRFALSSSNTRLKLSSSSNFAATNSASLYAGDDDQAAVDGAVEVGAVATSNIESQLEENGATTFVADATTLEQADDLDACPPPPPLNASSTTPQSAVYTDTAHDQSRLRHRASNSNRVNLSARRIAMLRDGKAHCLLTLTPPRLFVALLGVVACSQALRQRTCDLARSLRRTVLLQAVPESVQRDGDGKRRVADWLVEKIDLSGFQPHVTTATLQSVREVFPFVREIRLLPEHRRTYKQKQRSSLGKARAASYDVSVVPLTNHVAVTSLCTPRVPLDDVMIES